MNSSDTRITYLFNRYYEKTATPEETDELMQLLYRAKDDQQLIRLVKQSWENLRIDQPVFPASKSEEILDKILQAAETKEHAAKEKRPFPWRKVAAAATIILAAWLGVYLWQHRSPRQQIVAHTHSVNNDIPPGGNRAMLTLGNGSVIVLDSTRDGMVAKQGHTEINKTGAGQLVYKAGRQVGQPALFNTISTPKGGQYQVILPDKSKVWLNAASSIRFPAAFSGTQRRVEITGEVYFEIAKNAAMPFKVVANGIEVEVLGTAFNVMAYDNEPSIKTTLLEGSLRITSQYQRSGTAGSKILTPGQQALLDNDGGLRVLDKADVEKAVAWKNGLFVFKGASIEEIMRQAARWYNIEVSYQGKIPVKQFTGKVSRHVNISELLNMLNYAGVNSKIEGRKVLIKP